MKGERRDPIAPGSFKRDAGGNAQGSGRVCFGKTVVPGAIAVLSEVPS